MRDPRYQKLADVVVNYCTGVKEGDLVRLTGSAITEPLLVQLYETVLAAGGNPFIQMAPHECAELLLS